MRYVVSKARDHQPFLGVEESNRERGQDRKAFDLISGWLADHRTGTDATRQGQAVASVSWSTCSHLVLRQHGLEAPLDGLN